MDNSFRLRPMDLRDILDDTFDLYKENFALFVTISAIVFMPFNFLVVLVTGQFAQAQPTSQDQQIAAAIAMGITLFITILFASIATYIGMGALSTAVSERYLGRSITVKESYSAILNRFGPFMKTLILSIVLAIFGSILLLSIPIAIAVVGWFIHPVIGVLAGLILISAGFLAAIYLWFALYFIIPVFIIEGLSGTDAIRRSFQLFAFNRSKAFFTLFLVTMIVAILQSILVSPFNVLFATLGGGGGALSFLMLGIQGALNGIAQSVLQPIQMIVQMLLYYDIRIRREGFDLEVLASELRGTSPYDAAPLESAHPEQPLGDPLRDETIPTE